MDAGFLALLYGSPGLLDHFFRVQLFEEPVAPQYDEVLLPSQAVLANLGVRADAILYAT